MPIVKSRYPSNWDAISKHIRSYRADNRCEFCSVENHSFIQRAMLGPHPVYYTIDGNLYDANHSILIGYARDYDLQHRSPRATKVVLTVAHLNHNTLDNKLNNLAALCQRCHLRYDAPHRAQRRKANKLQTLF